MTSRSVPPFSCYSIQSIWTKHQPFPSPKNTNKVPADLFKRECTSGEHIPLWSQHLCCITSVPSYVMGTTKYFPSKLRNQDSVFSLFTRRGSLWYKKGCWLIFNFILWNTSLKVGFLINPVAYAYWDKKAGRNSTSLQSVGCFTKTYFHHLKPSRCHSPEAKRIYSLEKQ